MSLEDNHVMLVAHNIERYLLSHPNAADTMEGIAKWWLQRQRFNDSLDQVCRALELLMKKGLVQKVTRADGKNIYRYAVS